MIDAGGVKMLKWLPEASRPLAAAIIFATLVTAQAQAQSDKPITLIVNPDLSLNLGSEIVTRDGLVAALEAATNGDLTERIILRPAKGVSLQDLMAVAIALGRAGYVTVTVWAAQPDEQR
jgi:biopolymer transport protein ExbD